MKAGSSPDARRTLSAAAHPIVLGAAAVIVVNDYVLRTVAPGWLTGKLSDAGFLVVAPVAVAAVLAMVGVRARWARGFGLIGTAALYTVLQLWPPLGAFFRPSHVADVEDLLVLPALAGAAYAWRSARRRPGSRGAPAPGPGVLALPVLAGALLATSYGGWQDASLPCGEDMLWDAREPLYLHLDAFDVPTDTDAFVRGLRLTDGDGVDVPLVTARDEARLFALVCAREGLRGDTAYTWRIGPWEQAGSNELGFVHDGLPTVRFRTLPGDGPAVADATSCAALATRTGFPPSCGGGDTGPSDTGPFDTGPSDTGPFDTGPVDEGTP